MNREIANMVDGVPVSILQMLAVLILGTQTITKQKLNRETPREKWTIKEKKNVLHFQF